MAALVVITQYAQAGITPGTGNPIVQVLGFVGDPALQGDGSGHDMQTFNTTITLPAATPATWLSDIRTGIIAACAGFLVPFTVASNRVFLPDIV